MSRTTLTQDAKNRALRVFVVNLTTDVGVALALVLVTAFSRANGWGDLEWTLMGFTFVKTAIVTAGSFVLRRFLDPSSIPTPLPPAPVPAPVELE